MAETSSPNTRNERLSAGTMAVIAVVLLATLFVSVIAFSSNAFRTARLDLTETGTYTLSEGTKEILRNIEEPITLRLFYSERVATNFAPVRVYADRVRDLLEQYVQLSRGKLILEVIEPEPFSPDEDLADALGVQGVQVPGTGETLYFGLVGTNSIDGREVIPFFPLERQQFLELDMTKLIFRLDNLDETVIGMVTNLPLDVGPGGMMAAMQGLSDPYALYTQLLDFFEVNFLEQEFDRVPEDVDVLMLVHPQPLSEATLYAIDQFVMRGGRVMAFLDPYSEMGQTPGPNGQPQPGATLSSVDSLGPLLENWGVRFVEEGRVLVGDQQRALRVAMNNDPQARAIDYVVWMDVGAAQMSAEDPVTTDLSTVVLATAGALAPVEGAATGFTPLMRSTAQSGVVDVDEARFTSSARDLLLAFAPDEETYTLAARVTGPVTTAFPEGAPAVEEADPALTEDSPPAEGEEPLPPHLEASQGEANIIVVADSDLFDDKFWVQIGQLGNERIVVPTADNANFVLAAVDNLTGSDALISLRAREETNRPFTRVDELRRQADQRFLQEEQRLEQRLSQLEGQLRQLQLPETGEGEVALSLEQQRAIEAFRTEIIETRTALRDVQRELRREIEGLEGFLRFVNIGLMPILVAGFAIGLALLRQQTRRRRMIEGGRA